MIKIPTGYVIRGKVYTSRGTVANSVVHVNSDFNIITDSEGKYVANLGNLAAGFVSGDDYILESWDEFNNEYVSITITADGTGLEQDIYLEARTRETEQGRPVGQLTPVILRTIGDKPISLDNPLIVYSDLLPLTKFMQNNASGQPLYICEAAPGTPKTVAKWRIKKMIYGNGTTSPPTGEEWANGNSDFDKICNSRSSYTYS